MDGSQDISKNGGQASDLSYGLPIRDVAIPSASNVASTSEQSNTTIPSRVSILTSKTRGTMAEVRKARMNSDIISDFKTTCPPGTTPYMTGIGLYTHVEGSARAPQSPYEESTPPPPEFLPIQRPSGSVKSGSSLPEEVQKLWEEIRDTVQAEEKLLRKSRLGLEDLKTRYEALPVPDDSMISVEYENLDAVVQGREEILESRKGSEDGEFQDGAAQGVVAVPESDSRLQSGDVAMQGTEEERGRKLPSGTHIYRPDPRKERRGSRPE